MKMVRTGILVVLACAEAFGQTPPASPEFEVASIKPSAAQATYQVNVGVHIDGAQFHCSYLSLKDYIGLAYRMKLYQITGPDWMATERFDIDAKLPEEAKRAQVPEMVKALLVSRFQMKSHHESREFPVYGLVVGKGGLKIKESPEPDGGSAPSAAVEVTASGGPGSTTVNLPGGSYYTMGNNRFEAKRMTMAVLADTLARYLDRPVVDMTELKGNYDLKFELSPEDFRAMRIRSAIAAGIVLPPEVMRGLEGVSDESLFAALQSLGLKLESRKAPLDVLVIDQVEKTPTAN